MTETTEPLIIDVWSDIACPWCYIGKGRLRDALSQVERSARPIQVRYHAFQLDPHAGPADGRHEVDVLALKFGSRERAAQMLAEMTQLAANEGLDFDFAGLVPTNTLLAHRLIAYAQEVGGQDAQGAVVDALFAAHFTDGQDVGDSAVLGAIAQAAGLDRSAALTAIADEATLTAVEADKRQAAELGITGVPFYVLDGRYGVSGAQPSNVLAGAVTKILAGETP